VETRGGLRVLRPITIVGEAWIEDTVLTAGWKKWDAALLLDPAMVDTFIEGARAHGLEVVERCA
jgi:hypothetical protein